MIKRLLSTHGLSMFRMYSVQASIPIPPDILLQVLATDLNKLKPNFNPMSNPQASFHIML